MDIDARYVMRSSLRVTLASPDRVDALRLRPPALSLKRRAESMAACRSLLEERGCNGLALYRGSRTEPEAVGQHAERLLQQDEQQADTRGYWWRYDVAWSSPTGARIVSVEDYDGRELLLVAWGPGTETVLSELQGLLAPQTATPVPEEAVTHGWRRRFARPGPSL